MARLGGYRGIAQLTGLTLAAEVVDWRRFACARAFMGFAGLIPAEYSSGSRSRRGHITKAGPEGVRTALVEAAWAYRYRPAIGATLRRRQAGLEPGTLARSWKAQQRLHAKYKKMIARGKPPGVAVVASPASWPVGFQNSATGPDLDFYAARSYSLMRPPRTGRRLIRFWEKLATGWSGRGARSWRPRWGRRPL